MLQPPIADAMLAASSNVLETMFFAEGTPILDGETALANALACALDYRGAVTGSFHVVVDRAALSVLCSGFYGEDGEIPESQMQELLCELTNMLAGSTLSRYAPEHSCTLSCPLLCDVEPEAKFVHSDESVTHLNLAIEDGVLSILCLLRQEAGTDLQAGL